MNAFEIVSGKNQKKKKLGFNNGWKRVLLRGGGGPTLNGKSPEKLPLSIETAKKCFINSAKFFTRVGVDEDGMSRC